MERRASIHSSRRPIPRTRGAWTTTGLALALWGLLGCGASEEGGEGAEVASVSTVEPTATTATTAASATTEPSLVETTLPSAGDGLSCDESAEGGVPWLFALDIETGELEWTACRDLQIPPMVIGRTTGATLIWQQDGRGGAETIAVDDTGTDLWRHASDGNNPGLLIGAQSVVSTLSEVEVLASTDGSVRWSHPLAVGTPIGIGEGLVIEVVGGPYAPEGSTNPADAGQATLRALDELSGEEQWASPVVMMPLPPPSQYLPTVGNDVIAVPTVGQATDIFDIVTGTLLRQETGVLVANGDWLVRTEPNTGTVEAVSRGDTGEVLDGATGQPINWPPDAEHAVPTDDIFTVRRPDMTSQVFEMLDATTGTVRWTLDTTWPMAHSSEGVLAPDGSTVRLLDRTTGAVRWEYEPPSGGLGTMAAFGNGIVVVTAPLSLGDGPPPSDEEQSMPDCTGGVSILDTEMLGQPLAVVESADGRWYCVEWGPSGPMPDSIPDTTSTEIRITNAMRNGSWGSYLVVVGDDFPDEVTVRNENGEEFPVARGRAGDYLVIFDPFVGQPSSGSEALVERTVELIAADGSLITEFTFQGFGVGEFASFEQFLACLADFGVEMPMMGPGDTLPQSPTAPRETLFAAWQACEDLSFSYFEGNGQGTPESLENMRFVDDCLAEAGYFPMLNQPAEDQAAYDAARTACEAQGPGRAAIVQCLRDNGLEVVVDGVVVAGPHDPTATDVAWQACRDTYVTWIVGDSMGVPEIMVRTDCLARLGWLSALHSPAIYSDPAWPEASDQCSNE